MWLALKMSSDLNGGGSPKARYYAQEEKTVLGDELCVGGDGKSKSYSLRVVNSRGGEAVTATDDQYELAATGGGGHGVQTKHKTS